MDCERVESCNFFNNKMIDQSAIAELYMQHYCWGDNSKCARHYMFNYIEKRNSKLDDTIELKIAELSDTLYPYELEKIKQILS